MRESQHQNSLNTNPSADPNKPNKSGFHSLRVEQSVQKIPESNLLLELLCAIQLVRFCSFLLSSTSFNSFFVRITGFLFSCVFFYIFFCTISEIFLKYFREIVGVLCHKKELFCDRITCYVKMLENTTF